MTVRLESGEEAEVEWDWERECYVASTGPLRGYGSNWEWAVADLEETLARDREQWEQEAQTELVLEGYQNPPCNCGL